MNKQTKALGILNDVLQKQVNGTTLASQLSRVKSLIDAVYDKYDDYVSNKLNVALENVALERHLPCDVVIAHETIFDIEIPIEEFFYILEIKDISLNLLSKDIDQALVSFKYGELRNSMKERDRITIHLYSSFTIENSDECHVKCEHAYGSFRTSSASLEQFVADLEKVSIERIENDLELSDFLDEDNIEETLATVLDEHSRLLDKSSSLFNN